MSARPGRPPSTSREELEAVCLDLFSSRGFEPTSVEDVARAAGIGRRTFFRYFETKNDAVWGAFEEQLDRLRERLRASPPELSLTEAVRRGVLAFNVVPDSERARHRQRMTLILGTPALQAHATLRYAQWRAVIAEFAAARLGARPEELLPRTVGHVALGAALAAYETWLEQDGDLAVLLEQALQALDLTVRGAGDGPVAGQIAGPGSPHRRPG